MYIFILYLIIVNITAFFMYLVDKVKAIKGRWRIPERTLIGIAVIGGSLGAFLSMNLFRHKTKHKKFTVTVPLLLVIQVVIVVLVLSYCL